MVISNNHFVLAFVRVFGCGPPTQVTWYSDGILNKEVPEAVMMNLSIFF